MASSIVDNLIALHVLKTLVVPFEKTQAFKLGIIDRHGKNLIPTSKFTKPEQYNAYNYLTRFVFNLKKLLARLPGGDNMLKNFVAALLLLKENKDESDQINEFKLYKIMDMIDEGVIFVEETLLAKRLISEQLGGASAVGVVASTPFSSVAGSLGSPLPMSGVPTNVTGPKVSTDVQFPIQKKKVLRPKKPVEELST